MKKRCEVLLKEYQFSKKKLLQNDHSSISPVNKTKLNKRKRVGLVKWYDCR